MRVSEAYPDLFHYTTLDGLRGIVSSRRLWATHYADLNDSSELQRFREKAIEFVMPLIRSHFETRMNGDRSFAARLNESGGLDAVARYEAGVHLGSMHAAAFGPQGVPGPFITSFCSHDVGTFEHRHGLLSQWRGYGAGGGVALVLPTARLERLMKAESNFFQPPFLHLVDVKYDSSDLSDTQVYNDDSFEKFRLRIEVVLGQFFNGERPRHYGKILLPFVVSSTRVKHQGFREEREIRLVVAPYLEGHQGNFAKEPDGPGAFKTLKHRRRGEREVRYIELFDGSEPLPIERVIVGPSAFQNLNLQTVREIVAGHDVEVCCSETPFIG